MDSFRLNGHYAYGIIYYLQSTDQPSNPLLIMPAPKVSLSPYTSRCRLVMVCISLPATTSTMPSMILGAFLPKDPGRLTRGNRRVVTTGSSRGWQLCDSSVMQETFMVRYNLPAH